jgi:hypothetical protein
VRNIDDILHFRSDISPFIVHLTKGENAKDILKNILRENELKQSGNQVSDLRFAVRTIGMDEGDLKKFFGAICFTETPLNEIHCLFDIRYRQTNLQPYGLVFLKENLSKKGVSPVFYINNELGDKGNVLRALCGLRGDHPDEAAEILPLVAIYGNKITPPGADEVEGSIDFRWEREWRFPFVRGPLTLSADDVFIGLCPDNDIDEFEREFPGYEFVDPLRNMKWNATKLINARQRLDIQFSVV